LFLILVVADDEFAKLSLLVSRDGIVETIMFLGSLPSFVAIHGRRILTEGSPELIERKK
jgi:hypothetical protein